MKHTNEIKQQLEAIRESHASMIFGCVVQRRSASTFSVFDGKLHKDITHDEALKIIDAFAERKEQHA